jgi:hypothetical protein
MGDHKTVVEDDDEHSSHEDENQRPEKNQRPENHSHNPYLNVETR